MNTQLKRKTQILLADDDPADRKLISKALAEGGFNCELITVESGDQVLSYLDKRNKSTGYYLEPDLLLLDLNMPKVDGREVLEKMRSSSNYPNIPVIVLTTSSEDDDVARSYRAGANSFITKPASYSEFKEMVCILGNYWLNVVELPSIVRGE